MLKKKAIGAIQAKLHKEKIQASIDETTDSLGSYIENVIVWGMKEENSGGIFLQIVNSWKK